jgi:hypothetical protein
MNLTSSRRNDVLRAGASEAGGTPDYDPGPKVVETKPVRPKRSRKVLVVDDEEALNLEAAK